MKIYCEHCKKIKLFTRVAEYMLKKDEKGRTIYECTGLACSNTFEQVPTKKLDELVEQAFCADKD